MKSPLITLGIETSCDETSVGILQDGRTVLAHVVSSQIREHQRYGGVVPEMAARLHVEHIIPVIKVALEKAKCAWTDIGLIAATQGPGLIGAVAVGLSAGKTLAYTLKLPFVGVHHIEGHIYANLLDQSNEFIYPLLALVASGGHTQLILVPKPFEYRLIGNTMDDAIGEAFDKSARLLGLGYPGGPIIDKLAAQGNRKAFLFPPVKTASPYDFSFSGLKTAVLKKVTETGMDREPVDSQSMKDFCASIQNRLIQELISKTFLAEKDHPVKQIVIAGGVTANSFLRESMTAHTPVCPIYIPRLTYCTDNGAMIAAAGYARFMAGYSTSFDAEPFSSRSLETYSLMRVGR